MVSSTTNEDEPTVAGYQSTTDDEMTSECHARSISSCSAGARETHTVDGSDVLAMPT